MNALESSVSLETPGPWKPPEAGLNIDFNGKITDILDFRVSDRAVQSTLPWVYRDIDHRFQGIGSILKNCSEHNFDNVFNYQYF